MLADVVSTGFCIDRPIRWGDFVEFDLFDQSVQVQSNHRVTDTVLFSHLFEQTGCQQKTSDKAGASSLIPAPHAGGEKGSSFIADYIAWLYWVKVCDEVNAAFNKI